MGNLLFRRFVCVVLVALLLTGCTQAPVEEHAAVTQASTVPAPSEPTAPPDGEPGSVKCTGSYTGPVRGGDIVAQAGEYPLTSGVLNVFYSLEVASYLSGNSSGAPSPEQGMDTQMHGELTWQQFFLDRALDRWHTCTALVARSKTARMPIDPEYAPYQRTHDLFLREDLPMIPYLYGWDPGYKINELHIAYLDILPSLLDAMGGQALAEGMGVAREDLLAAGQLLNEAYAYYTFELFHRGPGDEEIARKAEAVTGAELTVSFRHLLLVGEAAPQRAADILESLEKNGDVYDFAMLANQHSQDVGSKANGGLYAHVKKGQMTEAVDSWLFSPERVTGDLGQVESPLGIHLLWYLGEDQQQAQAEAELTESAGRALVKEAKAALPMTVEYDSITLSPQIGGITLSDLLYPDIGHEHIPVPPVYLQQDFPHADYGMARLDGSGCGITSFAMMASYMADEYLTPPVMADIYSKYCIMGATDSKLMSKEAPALGFYVDSIHYDWRLARERVDKGLLAISLQQAGPYTSGGHYLVIRRTNEDGSLSVWDSNIYNYGDVPSHWDDHHSWNLVGQASTLFVVYQPKITRIGACARCGEEETMEGLLNMDYICPKCIEAMQRRGDFLALAVE